MKWAQALPLTGLSKRVLPGPFKLAHRPPPMDYSQMNKEIPEACGHGQQCPLSGQEVGVSVLGPSGKDKAGELG